MLSRIGEKLPVLAGSPKWWNRITILLIVIGVTFGLIGAVRTCSIFVSIGAVITTYSRFTRSAQPDDSGYLGRRRNIELIVPTLLCVTLFVVSLTLPHAK